MFPVHNPAQQVFNWHCKNNHISDLNFTSAAVDMREHVYRIRKLYNMPIGRIIPYDDADFRAAYLQHQSDQIFDCHRLCNNIYS